MVSFPWSSLSFHPTPTFIPSGHRWGEEGMTLEVPLTRAFVCIVQAQGFLIRSLSCPVISPHDKRAAFSGTDPCCAEVTSDGGLLLYSAAAELARCWGKMQIWDNFPRSSVHFWALGRNGILSDDRMRGFTWVWWILTFHSCNCKKSLFVRATVNFLCMLLLFRENKYFPPLFYIPSSLMLKTGNWSGASKCNLAQRLSLPPNDTCCSSLLRQSCSHYP